MTKDRDKNTVQPGAGKDEQEQIRRRKIDELDQLCDRVSAEARQKGLTEEILNQLLEEEPRR